MEWKYVSPQWPESVTFMTVEEMIDKFDLTENQINHLKQVAQNYNQNNMTTKQYITQLLAEIKEKGCTISEEVLSGSLDTLVTLAKGEQRLEENRVYMDSLNNSKEIIGHHITEPEDVKPDFKVMVKGEWYHLLEFENQSEWIFMFDELRLGFLKTIRSYSIKTNIYYENTRSWGKIEKADTIRKATREEVLKYFPNEFQ